MSVDSLWVLDSRRSGVIHLARGRLIVNCLHLSSWLLHHAWLLHHTWLLHHAWLLHVDSFWVRSYCTTTSSAVTAVMVSIELKVARVGILQILGLDEHNVQDEAQSNDKIGDPWVIESRLDVIAYLGSEGNYPQYVANDD